MFKPVLSAIACVVTAAVLTMSAGAAAESSMQVPADPPQLDTRKHISPIVHQAFRAMLEARRAEQIARLEKYLEDGMFPRNRITRTIANIFRDEDGLLCAIAFLISEDGLVGLVEDTATNNNTVRIGELKSGPLLSWVAASGLTQEEVGMVQLPDSPVLTGGGRDWFLEENNRIKVHMAVAIAQLKKNTDASLELATKRLLERVANG